MGLLTDVVLDEKIKISLERIHIHRPRDGSPFWVGFSGGKDSQVVLELVKMSGLPYEAHYNITGVDPPEVVYFIKKYYPEVIMHPPEKTMWKLIEEKCFPPTPLIRYCCKELKEKFGAGIVVLGTRRQESIRRAKRGVFDRCMMVEGKFYLHPIVDWSTDDVWAFIKRLHLPYCSLYNRGRKRLGCLMCPQKRREERLRDAEDYPRYYQLYLRAFDKMLKRRKEHNLPNGKTVWNTPEEVMDWWLNFKFGMDSEFGSGGMTLL